MHTDKETYLIFTRCPEFISELSGLPSYGKSQVKSVNIKAIDRTADGVEFPEDPAAPLRVFEIQFQRRRNKGNVYRRLVTSMALIQEEAPTRGIEGAIFFGDKSCDPETNPWHDSDLISVFYLDEILRDLESCDPSHPLVAVFKPVFETDTETLVSSAKEHYNQIRKSEKLTQTQLLTLTDVFEHWLLERLPDFNKKQIAMILDLPDVRDTVCGKELLEEGREEGIVQTLITQFSSRFKVPKTVETKIGQLPMEKLGKLTLAVLEIDNLKALRAWLTENEA